MKLELVSRDCKSLKDFCGLRVWKKPKEGISYAIGVDVSEGVGGDASCAVVLDCRTGLHVATYWNNLIDTDNFAAEIYKLGSWYHKAFLCIEANNHGHAVIAHLSGSIGGLTYPNLYKRIEFDEYTQRRTKKIGFVTGNRNSKIRLIENLKSALKSGETITFDRFTIQELSSFVQDKKSGRMGAKGNAHDDRVMAYALAWEQARLIIEGQSLTHESNMPQMKYDPETGFPTGEAPDNPDSIF